MKVRLAILWFAALPLLAEPAKNKQTSGTDTKKPQTAVTPEKKAPNKTTPSQKKQPQAKESDPGKSVKSPPDTAPTEGKDAGKKSPHGRPAVISTSDLLDYEQLPEDRRKLIAGAISVAQESPWLPYKFGGSSPKDGGFDCSGAMHFVMNKAGLKPPRTSADQYLWVKEAKHLHETPASPLTFEHPSLADLKPGDLLFWSGTYAPSDGRNVNITHVAIYLGREKKDKRPVMINATDGRSYRGKQANGYGVYDFYLPKEGSKAKFAGYGTPPGITEMKDAEGKNP